MKKKNNKLDKPFAPMYIETITSSAWRSLPYGAQALLLLMKRLYSRKRQEPVHLSARFAAKELGASRTSLTGWLRILSSRGFVIRIKRGTLGLDGKGKAAEFRLTDEPFKGKPASREFLRWHPPQNGAKKNKTLSQKLVHPVTKNVPGLSQKLVHRRQKSNKPPVTKNVTHLEDF